MTYHIIQNPDPAFIYPYKEILIFYTIVKYIWEQFVNYRQLKKTQITEMPNDLIKLGVTYDQFLLGQYFAMDKMAFKILKSSIISCLWFLKIMANVLPFIWNNVDQIFPFIDMSHQCNRAVGYTLIEMFIVKAFKVPLEAYEMQIIDRKHQMVTKTVYNYIVDMFIEGGLTLVVIYPIVYGYLRLVQIGGDYYFFFLQIFILVITIVLAEFYPFITTYFNKMKQIKNQNLIKQIRILSQFTTFPLGSIKIKSDGKYDQHGAQYHGFTNKNIIIYNNLLVALKSDQISGVICHQIGHWYHWHQYKSLLFHIVLMGVCRFKILVFFIFIAFLFIIRGFS